MIISDLSYLETVSKEPSVVGGKDLTLQDAIRSYQEADEAAFAVVFTPYTQEPEKTGLVVFAAAKSQ